MRDFLGNVREETDRAAARVQAQNGRTREQILYSGRSRIGSGGLNGVGKAGYWNGLQERARERLGGSAQDVLELDQEIEVEGEGTGEQDKADDGEGADAASHGAQVFDEFLLLEGIAVGGFADALKLVFDALEGGALLLDLGAELAVAGADLGQAALDGLKVYVDGSRRWRMDGLRGDEGAKRGGEVAV